VWIINILIAFAVATVVNFSAIYTGTKIFGFPDTPHWVWAVVNAATVATLFVFLFWGDRIVRVLQDKIRRK